MRAAALCPAAWPGTVVVTYGDVPLLSGRRSPRWSRAPRRAGGARSPCSPPRSPTRPATGGCSRDGDGAIVGIVEHKDATAEQRAIREINSGIYAFDADGPARRAGAGSSTDNAQGEKYLTDVLRRGPRRRAGASPPSARDDVWQVEGVNDRVQLAALGARAQPAHCSSAGCAPG